MFKKLSVGLINALLLISPAFATTGVLYSGGGGGKPSVGFFRTFDEKDPLFQMIFLMFIVMLAIYFVWEFIKWVLSGITGALSAMWEAVRTAPKSCETSKSADDYAGGQVLRESRAMEHGSANHDWRSEKQAGATQKTRQRQKAIKPSAYASRKSITPPDMKIVNTLPAKRNAGRV